MAKPFSIQSPEDIAKEYAGNKQKIAQAMQMGIIDPTAGVLAGMFIDRMRSAQMQEQAPQMSVAQQVMGGAPPVPANPLPAGGLGATAPAAPPMTPPMGMAPPMPMPEAPPMGMADGGLAMLPVPDAMFDEPTNGGFDDGYAGGGIVAFNPGGPVKEDKDKRRARLPSLANAEIGGDITAVTPGEIVVTADREEEKDLSPRMMQGTLFKAPSELGGLRNNAFSNLDYLAELAPRKTKRAEELEAIIERERSPEERAKRKKEDMWMALAQLGAKMATTPGTLLQAASAGISEALPGAAAAAKERRTEERALTKELLAEERTANRELEARAGVALDMLKQYNTLEQAFQDRNFRNLWESLGRETQIKVARISGMFGLAGSQAAARATMYSADREIEARRAAIFDNVYSNLLKNAAFDKEYQRLFEVNPNAADRYLRGVADQEVRRQFGGGTVDLGTYNP